jgi:hypothetical protein
MLGLFRRTLADATAAFDFRLELGIKSLQDARRPSTRVFGQLRRPDREHAEVKKEREKKKRRAQKKAERRKRVWVQEEAEGGADAMYGSKAHELPRLSSCGNCRGAGRRCSVGVGKRLGELRGRRMIGCGVHGCQARLEVLSRCLLTQPQCQKFRRPTRSQRTRQPRNQTAVVTLIGPQYCFGSGEDWSPRQFVQ